jgi:hypothetical protein
MTLTQEQVELMTSAECSKHLKLLAKTYQLEKPITKELWPHVDSISNALLWLEDRIRYCNQSEIAVQANKTRWGIE